MALPLTALLPRLQRLLRDLRQRLGRRELLPATWIGALVALEVLGRWSSSDVADAPAVLVLLALVAFTWREHSHEPQRFVERVLRPLRALRSAIERHGFQAGSDLRREPLLPRKLPPILFATSVVALGSTALLVLVRQSFPTDARTALSSVSGALYYLLLALLWCALAAGSLSVLAPPILLQDRLERGEKRPTGRRIALVSPLFAAYFVLLGTLSFALERWVPLVASGVAVLVSACVRLAPGGPHLDMVWRPSEERRGARTGVVDLAWLSSWRDLILWCVIACLALLSGGDRLGDGLALGTESTVFTAGLSALFTWSTSAFLAGWALYETHENLLARLRNPERRRRPVVRLLGVEEDPRLRAVLEMRGFHVLFGDERPRSRTDVPIALRATPSESLAGLDDFDVSLSERWPLEVAAAELETEAVRWKLARRHELLCRRHLLRGLHRAFRAVPRHELEKAAGMWVDPHQASSLSLIVELEDDEGRTHVGPPYHKVLPLAARGHLYEVWRALEIDLVFVEIGVSFKQLRRVFGIAFEVYDMHAGKQCALERHFVGLPGLRVVIDEVSSDSSLELTGGYPEPDYEDIGRARVLHVFRDRGGDRERKRDPRGSDDVPSPELLLA